jgi:chemotaxis signal transduction protein
MQSLRFRVGERALAVDLRWIHEVCPLVNIRPLPQAPVWLRGLFDFHGQLLPVVDAGVMLGGAPVQQCVGARILLLHGPMNDEPGAPKATYGLLVDSVSDILNVGASDLRPVPQINSEVANSIFRQVLVLDNRIICEIKLDWVFPEIGAMAA